MKEELLELIRKGENERVEFKETPKLDNEIGEIVSGFSNTKRGRILIRVTDSGRIVGVTIGKNTIEELANYIKRNTDPQGVFIRTGKSKREIKYLLLAQKYPKSIQKEGLK